MTLSVSRIWNLPLYAQFVSKDNTFVRDRLISEGHGHFIVDPVDGFEIDKVSTQ